MRPDRARALLSLAPDLFRGGPAASHRLIWNLFGDEIGRTRDFLFRTVADRPLTAIIRSARLPQDPFDLCASRRGLSPPGSPLGKGCASGSAPFLACSGSRPRAGEAAGSAS
jgi:hypothetical protein